MFTRRQALQAGVSAEELQRRLLYGAWIAVMDDVLMASTTPVTPLTHAWTGVLAIGQPVALAGRFAATVFGLERSPGYVRPEFATPGNRARRELPGITVHRIKPEMWSTIWRDGLPLVPVPMMLRQVAFDAPHDMTRDMVQHALRRRQVDHRQLLRQLGRGKRGAAALRPVLEEVAPGYQARWEGELHRALLKVGVRLTPQTRVEAPDGRLAYLDLGDERLEFGVEIDGFLNHMARFAADRRRARMLAVELEWTIAPYAVEELVANMPGVVAEIASYVRMLEARQAA